MKNFKRVLSLALAALMVIGGLLVAPVDAKADATYTKVTDVSTIKEGGNFVFVVQDGDKYYAVSNEFATGKKLAAVEVTVSGDQLSGSNIPAWVVKAGDDGKVKIAVTTGTCLGYNKTNFVEADTQWTVEEVGTDCFRISEGTRGLYYRKVTQSNTTNQFGAYATSNLDPTNQYYTGEYVGDLMVFEYSGTVTLPEGEVKPEVKPEEGKLVTIAEALAAAKDTECKIKGVVTLIEGKNIFLQDATGGICVYLKEAPKDLVVGDTVEAAGKKGAYNGMPQLSNGTYTKSSGLTLTTKTVTIDAITAGDIGTYVKLTGLTVTEIFDNNGQYSTPNLTVTDGTNTIEIYKAIVEKVGDAWAIKVGDKIDVVGALGYYEKGETKKYQIRTTTADQITLVTEDAPVEPEQPVNPPMGDMNTVGLYVVLFAGAALVAVSVLGKKKMA